MLWVAMLLAIQQPLVAVHRKQTAVLSVLRLVEKKEKSTSM